jgi:tripartite-type tricarboxylate transporter receptor subunit TctC
MLAECQPTAAPQRLHIELARILRDPDVRRRLIAGGQEPVGNTPEEFAAEIKAELARWAGAVKASGIRIE